MAYTYKFTPPAVRGPYRSQIRRTRGAFVCITEPMGCFGFRYAVFRNRSSEVLVPLHDLTVQTRERIRALLGADDGPG
jgi:hypothetical protein